MRRRRADIFMMAMVGLQPAHGGAVPDNRRDGPARQIHSRPDGSCAHPLRNIAPNGPSGSPMARPPDDPDRSPDPASTAQSP